MENIFENAYFGKAYKTRDGRKVIFLRTFVYNEYKRYVSTGELEYFVREDGKVDKNLFPYEEDVVSEWQEEVDEEALCETALNFVVDFLNKNEICLVPYKNYNEIGDGTWNGNHFDCNDLTEAFEAGYRSKAMEG